MQWNRRETTNWPTLSDRKLYNILLLVLKYQFKPNITWPSSGFFKSSSCLPVQYSHSLLLYSKLPIPLLHANCSPPPFISFLPHSSPQAVCVVSKVAYEATISTCSRSSSIVVSLTALPSAQRQSMFAAKKVIWSRPMQCFSFQFSYVVSVWASKEGFSTKWGWVGF